MTFHNERLRTAVEENVSTHLGRPWRIVSADVRADDASHPAAVLSDGRDPVFVKVSKQPFALDQFEQERTGLRTLAERAGVLTPTVIGIVSQDDEVALILKGVNRVERNPERWRDIGRALAAIHSVKSASCGFDSHCYFGDLRLDNTPVPDWPAFYRDRRLVPRLEAAAGSGNLPADLHPKIERIIERLHDLSGPRVTPVLLHGDAHANNVLSTDGGPVFIDPAVHFGHPEYDLAHLDSWSPVPDTVLEGYRETAAVDRAFPSRRHLWRIATWLGVVESDPDPKFVTWLRAAVEPYV